ncbi:hypothetical protein JTB14_000746 [Gonioctena quinquepunctata]|nr:hypothetical protein JTB14_000746 [Gonioctena quinquepunctata]
MIAKQTLPVALCRFTRAADTGGSHCNRLEELYIRQNDIRDVTEVMYLQNLPNLKNLWLGENPCANTDGYRLAVIKALPQLQKLDNIQVSPDELRDAQRRGKTLYHPDAQEESDEEYQVRQSSPPQRRPNNVHREQYPSPPITPELQRSPTQQETTEYEDVEESEENYPREDVSEESREYSPPRPTSPTRRNEPVRRTYSPEPEYVERRRSSFERESPRQQQQQQYYEKSSTNNSLDDGQSFESQFREPKIVNSQSTSCIKDYTNGERYPPSHGGSEISAPTTDKRDRYTCAAAAHRPPFSRRPVTRNSNILSAVLCLVKELDYPSLEVVEMAVRCRMDELDE